MFRVQTALGIGPDHLSFLNQASKHLDRRAASPAVTRLVSLPSVVLPHARNANRVCRDL